MHHRGATVAYLSGDPSFTDTIAADHIRIEGNIRAVNSLNQRYGRLLKTDDRWNRLKKRWQELDYTEFSSTPKESFDNHTAIITDVLDMISHIGETSNLILDPEVTTYYLMDCMTFKLPLLTESIGQTRGTGAGLLVRRELNTATKRELATLAGAIGTSLAQANDRIEKIFLSSPAIKSSLDSYVNEANARIKEFLGLFNGNVINAPEIAVRPADYYETATKAIDASFNLYDKEYPILDELLENRISLYQKEKYTFISALFVILTIFIYVFTAFTREHSQLLNANERLRHLAVTDSLTQIYNRLKFKDILELEIKRFRRFKHPFSVIMFDIDNFKGINDNFGHEAGDVVLKTLTHTILWHVRITDTFARWGGDEFIMLVVETPLEGACLFAEKLRKAIEESAFDTTGKVTCSFGVTEFRDTDDIPSLEKRVDDALYEAKNSGRNRICAR